MPDDHPTPHRPRSTRECEGPAAFNPRRPFHRRDGLAAGLTKHRLDGPGYTNLFGSIRVGATVPLTPQLLAEAALLIVPGAVVSHHTAAALWGAVAPETPHTHVSVRVARDRRERDGLCCHVTPDPATTTHRGMLVTTPAQTFLDLAPHLGLVDLVILGDSLVHARVTSEAELIQAAAATTVRGAVLARRAADLVRAGAHSPMETRVRLMFRFAGLPEPRTQLRVGDAGCTYYLDLAWPELRTAAEYDGRQHAESPQQWGHDLGRREWLDGNVGASSCSGPPTSTTTRGPRSSACCRSWPAGATSPPAPARRRCSRSTSPAAPGDSAELLAEQGRLVPATRPSPTAQGIT